MKRLYRTFKQDCPAYTKIRLAEDKRGLENKDMMLDHNHDLSPKVFMNLPHQRRIDENVSTDVA